MATAATRPAKTAALEAAAPAQEHANPQGATQVATMAQNGSQVALPTDLLSELAKYAKDDAAKERPNVSKISLKSGIMHYMGDPVKDSNMDVVILCSVFRNVFYAGRYDPSNIVNPNCFALGEDEDTMRPHENVAEPENETCDGCERGEWGSDPNSPSGRGKACKQSRRLIVMPADRLESVKAVSESEMALLDVPVTSIGNWANLTNVLSTGSKIPVWAAVVNIATKPHPKKQFELIFTPMRPITSSELIHAIMARRNDALRTALAPWDETQTEAAAEEAKKAAARPQPKKKF